MPILRRSRVAALSLALALSSALSPRSTEAGEWPKGLAEKVDRAIDRGAEWLAAQWQADGSFPPIQVRGSPQNTIGTTALCGLALLAADLPRSDPRWVPCLELLKRLDTGQAGSGARNTYDTGVLLMLLTEYHAVRDKKQQGTSAKMNPCGLPDDVRAWVQELATSLEGTQLETGGWRYPIHPPADVSNTQYALLGLRAARDCGAVVRATTFQRALEWALALQDPDGPKVRRTEPERPGQREYVVDAGDRARGWPYQKAGQVVTGSTTTSGLAALVICNDALLKPRFGGYAEELQRKVRRSVQDGFAWLDTHFAVDRNPPVGTQWHISYLYGLERACLLAGREHVGKHDWYARGAEQLVGMQREDGRWSTGALSSDVSQSDVVDTSWALLFLKRAVKPATPIPAPVVTPGG
jgi:hypothetical protein